MKEAPPPDRPTLACLILLAIALHGRGLLAGFADQDLKALETVMVTSFPALLRGGAFASGFTPLSRELHLWWWGKAVGLDAVGFHVLAAALAAATAVLLYRAVAKGAGARAGLLAVGFLVAFAPHGTALASVAAGRELVALLLCALAIYAWTQRRWILLGLACSLAALSRETALLLPFAFVAADRVADRAPAVDRARRLLPAFVGVAVALALLFMAPDAARSGPGGARWILPDFLLAWMPRGSMAGLGSLWRDAPWWVIAVLGLAIFAVPRRQMSRPPRPGRGSAAASRGARSASPAPPSAATTSSSEGAIVALGLAILVLGLVSVAFAPAMRGAEVFAVPALGASIALGVARARAPRSLALAPLVALSLASLGANWGAPAGGGAPPARQPAERARFTAAGQLHAEATRTGPWIEALKPVCDQLAEALRTFAVGVSPDSTLSLALGPGARVACRGFRSIRFLAEMTPAEAAAPFAVLRYEPQAKRFVHEPAGPPIRARVGEGLLVFSRHEAAAACFEAAAAEAPQARELAYPLVVSLAAAGRTEEARARWREARARGMFPSGDTLAGRLMAGVQAAEADRKTTARLAAAVVADPTAAAPHLALGRHLLALGQARSAAIELAVGSGISRKSQDLYWLARAYDAMGSLNEALGTYRVALTGGLDSTEYAYARKRLVELLRTVGLR